MQTNKNSVQIILASQFVISIIMAPTLYLTYVSPPARSVLITAKALGIDLTLKEVNIPAGDTRKPEFLKINPQHTIPTLVDDDGFAIWDSHAIILYLILKYAKDDSLIPKDAKTRAIIEQRLHFDTGVAFPAFVQAVTPLIYSDNPSLDQDKIDKINEVYGFLEAFLDGKEWFAGDSVTIADYSLVTTVSSLDVLVPLDGEKVPKLVAWLKRNEGLPEYEENVKGLGLLQAMADSKLGKV